MKSKRRGSRKDIWTEAYARQKLLAWRQSGLTMTEFCRQTGTPGCRLQWWKRKLARMAAITQSTNERGQLDLAPALVTRQQGGSSQEQGPAKNFVEVALAPRVEPKKTSGCLELKVKGGYRVRIPVEFEPTTLRRLLDTLLEAR